jgi:hypothetical protein
MVIMDRYRQNSGNFRDDPDVKIIVTLSQHKDKISKLFSGNIIEVEMPEKGWEDNRIEVIDISNSYIPISDPITIPSPPVTVALGRIYEYEVHRTTLYDSSLPIEKNLISSSRNCSNECQNSLELNDDNINNRSVSIVPIGTLDKPYSIIISADHIRYTIVLQSKSWSGSVNRLAEKLLLNGERTQVKNEINDDLARGPSGPRDGIKYIFLPADFNPNRTAETFGKPVKTFVDN